LGGLFGGRSREEVEMDKRQKQAQQAAMADQYEEMVTNALMRLTRWAFPDSQIERKEAFTWQLWHTTDSGKKCVDVAVTLQFEKGRPAQFLCSESLQPEIAELNREDLDDALRMCICSISG